MLGEPGATIRVSKRNHRGEELLTYEGTLNASGEVWACLTALFNYADKDAGYVVFGRGDTFVEWYYRDRWYNVFVLFDRDDGHLKGWYCNITRPAEFGAGTIAADDLALDVFVSPGRDVLVLDEDEFAALVLSDAEQSSAWDAVEAIRQAVAAKETPFEENPQIPVRR
jgi:predicted RNA-binding protein associated with RNAse of E/G family